MMGDGLQASCAYTQDRVESIISTSYRKDRDIPRRFDNKLHKLGYFPRPVANVECVFRNLTETYNLKCKIWNPSCKLRINPAAKFW